MFTILIEIRIYYSINPLLLKDIYKDPHNISDHFWDVKIKNEPFGKIQKQ